MAQRVLLGLRGHVISHGDQRGVGRSTTILSILFSPLHGGALVLILALDLTFALASIGAWWERRSLKALDKVLWSQAIRAETLVTATCVLVQPEPCVCRRSMQSVRQVKTRRGCDLLCRTWHL